MISFKEDLLAEVEELRREVTHLRRNKSPRREPSAQPLLDDFVGHNELLSTPQIPKVSFREATDSVPFFDGYNVSLRQFIRACRRAKEIVPPSAERNLTKLLINKLRNRAYYAVEDEPCETVTQLIDLLTTAFGTAKTIDQYKGELSIIYIKPQEHILDYICRVKDLRSSILDAERRKLGYLSDRTIEEIDQLTARSFCDGLPLQYRLQMDRHLYSLPFEAFAKAKALAKREELDQDRYKTRDRRGLETPRNDYSRQQYARSYPRNEYSGPSQRNDSTRQTHAQPPPRNEYPRTSQQNNYSKLPPRNENYNRDRYAIEPPRDNLTRQTYNDKRTINNNTATNDVPTRRDDKVKWCHYCKKNGHTINECRQREYYNSQRKDQGNAPSPVRKPSPPHSGAQQQETRAVNVIEATSTENIDSEH
jgi:hypothetical protein